MINKLTKEYIKLQFVTGLISEDIFNVKVSNLITEDEARQLKDRAEESLEGILKSVINKIPEFLEQFNKNVELNEYVEDEQVGGRGGGAFSTFVSECEYGDDPNQIAEAIKDWAGNYMMGLNEPDFQGVSDAMTPEIYKLVKKCAPNSFIKEMKSSILGESKKEIVEESIGAMAASTALTASEIEQSAARACSLLKDKLDSKYLNRISYVFEELGHQWHTVYKTIISQMIQKHAPEKNDSDIEIISTNIYGSIIGLMAIGSGIAIVNLAEEQGISSVDELDSSELLELLVKANPEVISSKIIATLPQVLDQFYELSN